MRLDGFEHAPGAHCGSTSLRNLAAYYGWDLSEPASFGLASGLGFTYFELPESPHRLFFGRPLWLERAFFENLRIPVTDTEGQDWPTAWEAVTARLDGGDPVMAFVDIFYLDYYDTDTHFAPHSLLVVGYDETATAPDGTEGAVFVSDSEFDEVQTLPRESFRAAWSATDVYPLANRHLTVDGDPERAVAEAAREAVAETARYMRDPADAARELADWGTHGVPGIEAMAADVPEWTALPDPTWTARFAYQNVERRGTGGGAFRGLYAPFLDELGEAAGLPPAFADRMDEIADGWTAAGESLYAASERPVEEMGPDLDEAADRIERLADDERRFYEDVIAALDGRS